MLRSFLIYLSKAVWARQLVTRWKFAWRAASRFIAGEKLEDAIQAIRVLNEKGINATLDHLGENTATIEDARKATQDIIDAIDAIEKAGVRANVSVKLTQIGLALGEELCAENLERILRHADQYGNYVRVDMEDSTCVDGTLGLFQRMRHTCSLANTGIVIQAYLYRSEQDVRLILTDGGRIRLCKGAYKEPPDVAFPKKKDVDANFDRLTEIMIDGALAHGSPALSQDGRIPPIPAIGSHDPNRLAYAKAYAQKVGLPKQALEFQMLHGIRRDLQEQTVQEGYPVRIYVPYGTEWYPYFMRRLAERPANVWFFISNFFRR
ncbi:MAG: proline dehydrogenase family protein [Anaerolineales bacterium]|nr:proline dehydrogenase family protein [Anaerolineales bacterium]